MQNDRNSSLHRLLNTIDRRTLLGRGAAMMGGLLAGLSLRPGRAYGQAKPAAGNAVGDDTWNVVVTGEAMVCRPFSMQKEPEFLSIVKLMRESDVTYSHLEMNLGDFLELQWAAKGNWGGSYMIAEPRIAEDLKWAGVDIMSLCQNHSMDWGAQGILSTIKAMEKAGIAHAGTGRDLEEARCPVYVEKDKGRVALVAISSGNTASEWAGLAKGSIPGRPGINPLRLNMRYEVDHSSAEQLKAIGKKLGVLRTSASAPQEFGITPGPQSGQSDFAFVDGDKFAISSFGHPKDIEGNLRAIDEAKQMADLVMVAHHCNISEGARGDKPMTFARAFAKSAIDAGADIYIGHGWHKVLGIEIYKNKPLLHGVGNFFAQNEFIERVPADSYEAHGHNMDQLTTLTPATYPLHPGSVGDGSWWFGAVFQLKFQNKKLTEIRLHPYEMGYDISGEKPVRSRPPVGTGPHPLTDGVPRMASGANAQKILERIQKMSATYYGTNIEIKDGIGIVKIPV
jgi:poly-gamma-glutamate capsule biosynthesis protein CapA/YwtB (metallophosphatase superfamily)